MATFMLESLVLRGVAVRLGTLGYLRLGRRMEASEQIPGIIDSMQPLPGTRPNQDPNPNGEAPNVVDTTKGASPGAGRSRRHTGSPCCLGTARTTTATRWWRLSGGLAPMAAAKARALFAGFVAPVGEVSAFGEISAAPTTGRQERSR